MQQLSQSERELILSALEATCRSGGGSAHFTLVRKLRAQFGIEHADPAAVLRLQQIAASELAA